MFSLPVGLDILQIGGEHRRGLSSNLSLTGSVSTHIKSYVRADGFIGLKTQSNDWTEPVVDFAVPRKLETYDTFRFGELQSASATSSIYAMYSVVSKSSNYYVDAGYDNYGAWGANEWKPLLAQGSGFDGLYVGAYADSFVGSIRLRLNFARASSATDAANATRVSCEFRFLGYAA